jgi:hypothetical protein
MNFAKQLIKQAIKDNHLLTFASIDEPLEFYGKPKFKLLDWFDCSAFDDDEESIIDYPSKGYVNEWFEKKEGK